MPLLRPLALAAGLLLATPLTSDAEWLRMRSAHFVAVGDASERTIRDTLQQLEDFRRVLAAVLPAQATRFSVPALVMVFDSDASFAPYRPLYEGRPVEVAGYFMRHPDSNLIALRAVRGRTDLSTIFHEYAHALVANTVGAAPVWASEGIAEFYSTFESSRGGRSALIGAPHKRALLMLQTDTPMPLAQLFAIQHDSRDYNEGDRRSMLYAESWALVHYLTIGNQARRPQWERYLQLLKNGEVGAEAAVKAFGGDLPALERELRQYVRRFMFQAIQYEFPAATVAEPLARAERLPQPTAMSYLGDLLARLDRPDDARTLLGRALGSSPDNGSLLGVLGLVELRAARLEAAAPLLERAAALAPDDPRAVAGHGRALLLQARSDDQEATYQRARQQLSRALELEPDNAFTALTLASAEMGAGADPARAVALLRQVLASQPEREDVRLMLGEALVAHEELDAAVGTFSVLVARGSTPQIKDAARSRMALIATLRSRRANVGANRDGAAASASAGDGGVAGANPAVADASGAPRGPSAPPPAAARRVEGGRVLLDLRPPAPGEQRVQGLFSAVECAPGRGAIVLVITAPQRTLRFSAAGFDAVDFISYRSADPGGVSCGAQPQALPAIVTYRGASDGAATAQAIAVELVPDGYVAP